ncbi:hypothetical protein BV25DRAFT_1228942 [Artomyces pyxidatus]|uniref:Uncharacterized protein n=1 Tax=Artomyces pyxidatus TaxID=48021 RepID=A0ACB8SRF7_9AGAM|nr:hypothetical protein BV25DRAFT_1228942 [Artomyces pyxidatus]
MLHTRSEEVLDRGEYAACFTAICIHGTSYPSRMGFFITAAVTRNLQALAVRRNEEVRCFDESIGSGVQFPGGEALQATHIKVGLEVVEDISISVPFAMSYQHLQPSTAYLPASRDLPHSALKTPVDMLKVSPSATLTIYLHGVHVAKHRPFGIIPLNVQIYQCPPSAIEQGSFFVRGTVSTRFGGPKVQIALKIFDNADGGSAYINESTAYEELQSSGYVLDLYARGSLELFTESGTKCSFPVLVLEAVDFIDKSLMLVNGPSTSLVETIPRSRIEAALQRVHTLGVAQLQVDSGAGGIALKRFQRGRELFVFYRLGAAVIPKRYTVPPDIFLAGMEDDKRRLSRLATIPICEGGVGVVVRDMVLRCVGDD